MICALECGRAELVALNPRQQVVLAQTVGYTA